MKIFGYEIKLRRVRNNYAAAKRDRLTEDWVTGGNLVADQILRWQLTTLRGRSRDLWQNNDYVKNFGRKLKTNVVGHNGITLQSKIHFAGGGLHRTANAQVEAAWAKWATKKNASVTGQLSLTDILCLVIEAVARDGEVLIRKHKGYSGNKFRFALQVLEADHLDEAHNNDLPNGNRIRMGIEKNDFDRPVAYHLRRRHPGDYGAGTWHGVDMVRVPADEIIHLYVQDRPSQTRGVPWIHTAVMKLRNLGAYEEAAVINARVGASKMGFIVDPPDGEYTGDAQDGMGNVISEVEPGILERLPSGADFKEFKTEYPTGEFPLFTKAMLRGAASGMGCSYNSLANDLEGVNFSSLRSGLLEERDGWKMVQRWFVEHVLDDIFADFVPMAILSGQLSLAAADMDKWICPKWQARTWEWVDPLKDIKARVEALDAGLTSRTMICAEQGIDFADLLEQLAEEKKLMAAYGVTFGGGELVVGAEPGDGIEGKKHLGGGNGKILADAGQSNGHC